MNIYFRNFKLVPPGQSITFQHGDVKFVYDEKTQIISYFNCKNSILGIPIMSHINDFFIFKWDNYHGKHTGWECFSYKDRVMDLINKNLQPA